MATVTVHQVVFATSTWCVFQEKKKQSQSSLVEGSFLMQKKVAKLRDTHLIKLSILSNTFFNK
jgi:hypothetical protein